MPPNIWPSRIGTLRWLRCRMAPCNAVVRNDHANYGAVRFSSDGRSLLTINGVGAILTIDLATGSCPARPLLQLNLATSISLQMAIASSGLGTGPGFSDLRSGALAGRLTENRQVMTFWPDRFGCGWDGLHGKSGWPGLPVGPGDAQAPATVAAAIRLCAFTCSARKQWLDSLRRRGRPGSPVAPRDWRVAASYRPRAPQAILYLMDLKTELRLEPRLERWSFGTWWRGVS